MAAKSEIRANKKVKGGKVDYLKSVALHPFKANSSRRETGLPRLAANELRQFLSGRTTLLNIAPEIEISGHKSAITTLSHTLMLAGILKDDPKLTERGFQIMEADLVATPVTPDVNRRDYGLKLADEARGANASRLLVNTVLAMRDLFDPQRMWNDDGFNPKKMLEMTMLEVDSQLDHGLVGVAQTRELLDVISRRLTVGGVASGTVMAPFLLAELANSTPSEAIRWFANLPPGAQRTAIDALVGAVIGNGIAANQNANDRQYDPWQDRLKNRITKIIFGALVSGGIGGTVSVAGPESVEVAHDVVLGATVLGVGGVKVAKGLFFGPKKGIRDNLETGLKYAQKNEKDIIPLLPSVVHLGSRSQIDYNRGDQRTENISKRNLVGLTIEYLQSLGFSENEIRLLANAQIANIRKLKDLNTETVLKTISASLAETQLKTTLFETIRMANHDLRHPEKYELMPVLKPKDLKNFIYTHGAMMKDAVDLLKKKKPVLALGMIFPSLWAYNMLDFFNPTAKPQQNEKNIKDAINFAGRHENTGGSGVKLMASFAYWMINQPQIVGANQFEDFYNIIADDLNNENADGMRSTLSLIIQPPPLQEIINAYSVFYLDFTLPEHHKQSQRGGVKHIDSLISNLLPEIDKNPRVLMDLLTFVSYCKTSILAKPYLEKLGYNVQIDQGRFFLDTSVDHIEGVMNRTLKILFDRYLSNKNGLVLGFNKEIESKKMTPEKANSIYRELSVIFEWTMREVPEFFESLEGKEILEKFGKNLYERAGVYSAGNVFSGNFVDIFYNVIKVLNDHKVKWNWKESDPQVKTLNTFTKLADEILYVMLRNTLRVNINPGHEAQIDNNVIDSYLSDNYGFFEFGLGFASDNRVNELANELIKILGNIEKNHGMYAVDSLINRSEWTPERKKIHLILTKISDRLKAELEERKNDELASIINQISASAINTLHAEEKEITRAGAEQ